MKKHFYSFLFVILLGCAATSCKEETVTPDPVISEPAPEQPDTTIQNGPLDVAAGFPEDFESSSKTAYALGTVVLNSGTWLLDDALIGNSSSDRKNGNQAIRMRNTGKLTMNFASLTGAATVTVKHAKYGTDADSDWELWVSHNGDAFVKAGRTVTTASTTLDTVNFILNLTGAVQFEIRKVSGGTARINFDDFSFNGYGVPGGTGQNPGNGNNDPDPSDGTHLAFGNPSNATTSTADPANYLMEKPQYSLSYNRDRGTANWVSWYVNSTWIGSAPRQDDFRADGTLPAGWYQVSHTAYTGSGFDRGHNCPSADRTNTIANNSGTFLMTNMIPQAPVNNQQTWANLENYTRTLINQGHEVYVIMGCYGTGGTGSKGFATTLNNGNVTVPARIWKVIVVLPNGTKDVSRVTGSTRVIAIDTPNENIISSAWGNFRTSVDAIETATGYDLLSNLPASVQASLEAQVDNGPTF
ncbi:MAG TPA: DNA/RNA non-specific endonuclease [Adhaeribacter sp.]|nr:DNA/RNA non-specific endonuclease [Adhaeribacter sp.]